MAGPTKGKQATKGARQIVEENVSTIIFYRNMALGTIAIYSLVTMFLFYSSLSITVICLNIFALGVYFGCYYLMTYIAKVSYTETGQILDSGIDLNMEGGMAEHVKDLVILTSGTQLLSIISVYFWWLWALAPLRACWMIWTNILGPWFFQEAPQDTEVDEKKRRKMERKMRMQKH